MQIRKCLFLLLISFCSNNLLAQTPKVLIIGIDGCRADALISANTPNMDQLIDNGTYSYDALNDDITISGPGWSAMLCGVWSDKHGVTDNAFGGQNYTNYPHFFSRVEAFDSNLHTASICNWNPINDQIVLNHADYKMNVGSDEAVANEAVNYLTNNDPDVLFLHFDECDGAGHSNGFSPSEPSYISKIESVDDYIGSVIEALENRPNYANENWLILSSTDHGGLGFSHGGNSIEEQNIFFVASGNAIANQEIKKSVTIQAPPNNCLSDAQELYFDGDNDYVTIPPSSLFDFGTSQDFTVECRVKTNQAADVAIVGNKDWDSGTLKGFVFSFKFASGPEWKVNIGDGSNRADLETGGLIADGEWYTLSVSFDRDGLMKMYQDGIFLGETSIANVGDINSGFNLRFGADSDEEYDYKGNIAEVRVWNKVIGANEILNWHCQSLSNSHQDYNDLLGHWKMNEGAGATQVLDYSPNANHGAVTNAIWMAPSNVEIPDFSNTPRITDIPLMAMGHLCIPIDPAWDLDGNIIYSACLPIQADCAIDELSIPILQQANYHLINRIESNALIHGVPVIFKAGDEIDLQPGFEVKSDTSFDGVIEDCDQ